MPDITLTQVAKRFGKASAVEDLNLEIRDGEFVSLLGPSGCGKTTTLRMIAGLETPTEGQIHIGGKKVFCASERFDVPPDQRGVGFLFQNYALWPHMTVRKNIAFGLENLKWETSQITSRLTELMAMLRIEELADRYPSELSGGQQQRVAIARTLATNPAVLLMDEPLSNLDAKLRMEMRTELKRLHLTTGATIIYVTHDQLEAMTLSTRICLLKNGYLQQFSPPLEVYGRPANTFTADFVGNPGINLVPVTAGRADGKQIHLQSADFDLIFVAREGEPVIPEGKKLILGLRPETVTIAQNGLISGKVYSSLPSGMETIVRLKVGETLLTSVIFGSIDFALDTTVALALDSDSYVLFDGESNERITRGILRQATPSEHSGNS